MKIKLLIIFGTISILFCSCVAIHYLSIKKSEKELTFFKKSSINIGLVQSDVQQTVKFPFRNNEGEQVKILKVDKSCSCSSEIVFPEEVILPGQTGEIVIGKYVPKAGLRKVFFNVKLDNGHEFPFNIISDAYQNIFFSPSELIFPIIIRHKGIKESLNLIGNIGGIYIKSIKVKSINEDWLTVKTTINKRNEVLEKSGEKKLVSLATIQVMIKPDAPEGVFSKVIVMQIYDNEGKMHELDFRCRGEIREEIYAIPQHLIILNNMDSNNYQGKIEIRSFLDEFKLISVESDILRCDFISNESPSKLAIIKVKIKENINSYEGKINFHIDHPRITSISIPVKIIFQQNFIKEN